MVGLCLIVLALWIDNFPITTVLSSVTQPVDKKGCLLLRGMDVKRCSSPTSWNGTSPDVSGQQSLEDEHQVPPPTDVNSQTSVHHGAVCAVNTSAGQQYVQQHVLCQDGQWKTPDSSTLWEIGRRQKRSAFTYFGPTGGPRCREICDSGWWKQPCKKRCWTLRKNLELPTINCPKINDVLITNGDSVNVTWEPATASHVEEAFIKTRHTAGPSPGSTLFEGSYKVIYEAKTKTGLVEFCEVKFLVKRNATDINIHCMFPDTSYTCPNGTKVGATCTSVCNDGNTTRILTITCQSNLTWSDYKICRACPTSLNIDETHMERITCSIDKEVDMMLCTVVCHTGYMTGRETYLMCGLLTNYTWSQVTKDNPLGVVPACVDAVSVQQSVFRLEARMKATTMTDERNKVIWHIRDYLVPRCTYCLLYTYLDWRNPYFRYWEYFKICVSLTITGKSVWSNYATDDDVNGIVVRIDDFEKMANVMYKETNEIFATGLSYRGIDVDHRSVRTTYAYDCPEGTALYHEVCVTCERGTFWKNGVCKPCPRGYYQSEYGKTCCEPCPAGNSTAGSGSRSSSDCVPDPKELYPLDLGYWDDEKEENANVDVLRCQDVKEKPQIQVLNVIVFCVVLLILGGMCFFCYTRFFGGRCFRFAF